jgi:hypothetical protein
MDTGGCGGYRGRPMRIRLRLIEAVVRETLLAVLVLSLFCLNLGAAGEAFAHDGPAAVAAHTDARCGDPLPGDSHGHVVCHACRPSIPVLPTPPEISVDACLVAVPVVYAPSGSIPPAPPRTAWPSPRGPPVMVSARA